MKTINSTLQFAKEYPVAFAALPEAYQADDCLTYIINNNESAILAQPKQEQEFALGHWTAIYNATVNEWHDYVDGTVL